jgi:hypothetical protein
MENASSKTHASRSVCKARATPRAAKNNQNPAKDGWWVAQVNLRVPHSSFFCLSGDFDLVLGAEFYVLMARSSKWNKTPTQPKPGWVGHPAFSQPIRH